MLASPAQGRSQNLERRGFALRPLLAAAAPAGRRLPAEDLDLVTLLCWRPGGGVGARGCPYPQPGAALYLSPHTLIHTHPDP